MPKATPTHDEKADASCARKLDATDVQLLKLLQRNGRATNQWLAGQVHLSPTPCLERVRRLEREGIIEGYRAVIKPGQVGFPMLVFAFVVFDRTADGVYERFRAGVAEIEEIVECHMITGDVDYVMKILVPDISAFRTLLEQKILKLPGVKITHSHVAMEQVKADVAVPIKL